MEPDQPHPHRDKHVPEQRSDASDRSSGPATSGPESTAHSQPHEGNSQPESPAAAGAQARYPGAAPTGANASREGWSKKIAERVGKMLNTPQRSAALGEEPEHPLDGSPEPIPALHPISMGFLGTIGVGIALGGYYLLTNVGSLMTWIAIALFIALGLDPIVRFMMRKGLTRPLAVAATMVSLLAIFGGFMALIIPTLVNQITAFITRAPEIVDDFLNSDWVREIDRQYAVSQRITTEVDRFFGDSGAVTNVFGGVLGVSQTVAQSMFGVLIVLVLAIYFLASLPGMMGFSLRLAPRSKRDRVAELTVRITRSVGNYVMGQATVAILNCLVALVLMSVLGVPFTALLTLLVAMLAFIPLVGGVIAGVLVTLVTLSLGWQTALIYAVCYFGYLQVEAYFVSPRIMRRAVAVPGAVAVISVIAGGTLAGVTGALMAIPVAASAMILLREVFIARQDRR
ncbi:AI-2E family transporter [Arthrobacter sp. JUb115]|uniref:AI-2E family transporter n=1 Tax=Arthrobacter sp. JUb115 TaxID=2485108 RepID=UPI0010612B71|nr:AI-2E family transporter [Arthrobacter sp. JUb115]TDU23390.1 putative PurR-regulated permease PerM [Arthrobacter sp. JUb115]